jgi:protein TonB
MIDVRLLENLVAYSAQVAIVILAGAVIFAASRVRAPRVRHAWWRGLLGAALVLPLLYGTVPAPTPAMTVSVSEPTAATAVVGTASNGTPLSGPFAWEAVVAGLLAAGTAFRLLWTAIGLRKLRRLRCAGTDVTSDFADLQQIVGTAAELRRDRVVAQPVTFGTRHPVVMLPDALFDQPLAIQQAVVCHELLHVQRRDWTWLVAEELLRAALWFNPAVWWALSQIQLTREEVVDAAVVRITGERRAYAEALVAFAEASLVTPVAAFSRRRHLFRRILLISKEGSMSPVRIIVSCVVMAVVAGTGSWYAAWAFPLQAGSGAVVTAPRPGVVGQPQPADEIGPLERQAKPVTAENPIPRRTYGVSPQYPTEAGEARGVAMIRVTLDAQGRVAELRDLRSRSRVTLDGQGRVAELRTLRARGTDVDRLFFEAAVDAVRQWQYEPPFDAPLSFDVSVGFVPVDRATTATVAPRLSDEFASRYDRAAEEYKRRLAANEQAVVRATGGPSERELRASREQLLAVERQFEERRRALESGARDASAVARQDAVRVGGAVRPPTKIKHVPPIYPEDAKAAGVQGVVIVEITIDAQGRVEDARILRSVPLLDQAAVDAILQWEFAPTLLNGEPTAVLMTVTVQFSLNDF